MHGTRRPRPCREEVAALSVPPTERGSRGSRRAAGGTSWSRWGRPQLGVHFPSGVPAPLGPSLNVGGQSEQVRGQGIGEVCSEWAEGHLAGVSLRGALLGTPASALNVQVAASLGSAAAGKAAGALDPGKRKSHLLPSRPSHMCPWKEPYGSHATWHPEAEAQGRCRVWSKGLRNKPARIPM